MSETAPRFDGELLKLGDREFVIPPLNWRRIRKIMPILERMKDITAGGGLTITEPMLDDSLTVIHEAISRNYPEITRDELEDLVDLANAPKLIMAVMGLSGLLQGEPAPAEAKALIGENSTPA
jgi:hypothetical protein